MRAGGVACARQQGRSVSASHRRLTCRPRACVRTGGRRKGNGEDNRRAWFVGERKESKEASGLLGCR